MRYLLTPSLLPRLLPCLLTGLLMTAACRPPDQPAPKAAPVPITSETLAAAPFRASLTLLGTAEPKAVIYLRTPATGIVRHAAGTLRTGRMVKAGERLFRVEAPELEQARREAELQVKSAANELERTKKGVAGGFMPEADLARREIEHEIALERLAATREDIARLEVRSPAAGRLKIIESPISGARVHAETLIAEIDAEGQRRVEAWATASDLERLETGLEIECRSADGQRLLGRGQITEIDGRLDDAGVARVVASISEDLEMPASGEGVELVALLEPKEAALTIPVRSLIVDGSLMSVFVLEAAGRLFTARARPVVVGGRQGDRVEILEGLEAGETVAVEGAELLADGLETKDVGAKGKAGPGAAGAAP